MKFATVAWAALSLPLVLLVHSSPAVQGSQVSDLLVGELPSCAVSCYLSASNTSGCHSSRGGCVCQNATLRILTIDCASKSCPVINQFETRNAIDVLCGVAARNFDTLTRLVCWGGMLIPGGLVALRLLSKIFLADVHSPALAALTADDGLAAGAYLLSLPCYYITAFKLLENGLGRDAWTLTSRQINDFSYWTYIFEPLYLCTIWFIKTSFLFLFIRLFASGQTERRCLRGFLNLRYALWGTVIANTLCISSFVITSIFQCTPVSYSWTKWKGDQEGTCINLNAMVCTHGVMGILFDLWILYLPISQLSSMNLPSRKKVQVGLMLSVGAIATLVSLVRIQGLVTYANSSNATRDNYGATAWSLVEISIAIMCSCLPALRLLLLRILPPNRSQSSRSQTQRSSRPVSTQTLSWPTLTLLMRTSHLDEARTKLQRPTSTFVKRSSTKESFDAEAKDHVFGAARRPSVAECLAEKLASTGEGPTSVEAIEALSIALRTVPGDGRLGGRRGSDMEGDKARGGGGDGGRDAAAGRSEPSATLSRRLTPDFFNVHANGKGTVGPACMAAATQKWALDPPSEEPEPQEQQDGTRQGGQEELELGPEALSPSKPALLGLMMPAAEEQALPPPPTGSPGEGGVYGSRRIVPPSRLMTPPAYVSPSPPPAGSDWSAFDHRPEPETPGADQEHRVHSSLGD